MSPRPILRYRSITPAIRQRIEDAIESLTAILDDLDGDPDFEPDADGEPSLGWTVTMAHGSSDDREDDLTPLVRDDRQAA